MRPSEAGRKLRKGMTQLWSPRRRYGVKWRLAGVALYLERLASPLLLPVAVLAGVFLLILFGLWSSMPGWLHVFALWLLAGVVLWRLWRALRGTPYPSRKEATRWLERRFSLKHAPLTALDDTLAASTPTRSVLWKRYRTTLLPALEKVGIPYPHVQLTGRDRFAIGSVVILLCFLGIAGQSWQTITFRVQSALYPEVIAEATEREVDMTVWVEPPAYTRIQPITLGGQQQESVIPIPGGSTLHVELNDDLWRPRVTANNERYAFEDGRVMVPLTEGEEIAVRSLFSTIHAWDVTITPDVPPTVTIPEPPKATPRYATDIRIDARDDHGLETLTARIRLDEGQVAMSVPGMDAEDIVLDIETHGNKTFTRSTYHELAEHPWAGMPVLLSLEATDALGQTGESGEVAFTLPEMVFTHPVAIDIADQRAMLALAPEKRTRISDILWDIRNQVGAYGGDTKVFLALTTASARLAYGHGGDDIESTRSLLWDTAVYVEFGGPQEAYEELRQALQELNEALADETTSREKMERLMRRLQQAMQDFAREQAENMLKRREEGASVEDQWQSFSNTINSLQMLQAMQQMEQLFQSGDRESAQEMAQRLQDAMENLRFGSPPPMPEELKQALEQMQRMGALIEKQRELMDRTGQQSPEEMQSEGAAQQQALRQELEGISEALGQCMGGNGPPLGLGNASDAMGDATGQMKDGDRPGAQQSQQEALDAMQQAMEDTAQQLMEQFGGSQGMGAMPMGVGLGALLNEGRNTNPFSPGDIPSEQEMQRSREILEELHRRSGEYYRPEYERDYIRRLLERF